MSIDTVWQEALHFIQGKVPKQVYDTWFIPVHLDRIEDSTAHIGVPNKFFGDWLGTHYGPLLAEAVSTARGLQSVPVESVNLLRTYNASAFSVLSGVKLPFALPIIFVGLETSAAFSVVGAIVAELPFGSKDGLGVIILSVHSDEEYLLRALAAGAKGYLLKETADVDLFRAVQAVAQGKS